MELFLYDNYSFFIYICWAILLLYRGIAGRLAERTIDDRSWRGRIWRIPILLAILLIAVLRAYGFSPNSEMRFWPRTFLTGIIADLFTVLGLFVTLWANRATGKNWRPPDVLNESHDRFGPGPYAYVRHPIYSGYLLMMLGPVMYFENAYTWVFFVMFCASVFLKAIGEEKLLIQKFPVQYPKYKEQVKMLIPFFL